MRFLVLMFMLGLGAAALAQTSNLSKADQAILGELATANQAEVELGKLAASRAASADVKNFAQKMVDDHTGALSQVQQLAQTKGVTLPTQLDSTHQKMEKQLESLKGADFDKAYMQHAGLEDHRKVLSHLKQDRAKAHDADLQALIDKLTPAVDEHLHEAQGLEKSGH